MTSTHSPHKPRTNDGTNPIWRAHNAFRIVTFLYAVIWVVVQYNDYARPWLAVVTLAIMGVWTAYTVWRCWRSAGRTNRLIAADVVLLTVLVMLNELILSEAQLNAGDPSVTTIWHATMVTGAALRWGLLGGVPAGVLAALCDLILHGYVNSAIWLDVVLLVGVGTVLGLAADTARRSTERLTQALRVEAATAERERLARSIHDSVLQVLARVRQRGNTLGGEAADLAKLAGEQEIALRALIATTPQESDAGDTDFAARLQVLRTARVHVSVPATPVWLPEPLNSDLFAVAGEALQNVDKHAGEQAQAWVLLEDLPDEVVLCVRDDGPGIPEGRLTEAANEGRMGVARSIHGRVEDLGGSLNLETAPGEGTEWEVRVPRPGPISTGSNGSARSASVASPTADGSEGGKR